MTGPSLADLKTMLLGLMPGLAGELAPGGKWMGGMWLAPNPRRGRDTIGSFKIWRNGAWKEYDEDVGGDILGLVAYVHGHDPKGREATAFAAQWARQRLGLDQKPATADERRALAERLEQERARAAQRQRQHEADAEAAREKRIDRAREIYEAAAGFDPADFSHPVVDYFKGRGVPLWDVQHACHGARFIEDLPRFAGDLPAGPAMVLPIMGLGGLQGIHATWLSWDAKAGRWFKAKREGEKQMLGAAKHGFVPVSQGEHGMSVREARKAGLKSALVLAEGFETAVALAVGLPECRVWACLSLGGVGDAPVQASDANAITVALENDIKPAALKAREAALARLEAHGLPVASMAPVSGSDFADVIALDAAGLVNATAKAMRGFGQQDNRRGAAV